ncbi:MAG TPA: response regulator [Bacteroidota bacterium]|nr:response regulator [Bacteroidota bacterium]
MKSQILLVEDEDQQRTVLTMLFESEGYVTKSYASAEEALQHLQETDPHLVVTDVKLTGMDGFAFYHAIRAVERFRKIPFVFITAYNDPNVIKSVTSEDAVAYVTKPYNLEDLLKTVKSIAAGNP